MPIFSRALRSAAVAVALAAWAAAPSSAHDTAAPASVSASVSISGAVEHALVLRLDDLRQTPAARIVTLHLPAGHNAGDKASEVRGVRLRDLIDQASIVKRDHNTVKKLAIIAGAADGYKVVFSWSELFNSDAGDSVLVLFERDGQPLSAGEGPLALVAGKDLNGGPRHVKWLQSVEVRQIVD